MYLEVYLTEYIFRFLTLFYYPVLEFMQLRLCDKLILNFKIDFASFAALSPHAEILLISCKVFEASVN